MREIWYNTDMKKPKTTHIIGLAVGISLLTGGVFAAKSDAALDWLGLEQKIQQQDETLDNHEARITNTENDVSDIQANTGTAPSSNRQSVPSVTTPNPQPSTVPSTPSPSPAPTPAPAPVTVTAFEQIAISGSEDMDCKLTYSDGTSKQWLWSIVTYNQGTKLTSMTNRCDASMVGRVKE